MIFQALTRRSAAEKTDMENLEILGDCFLKLAMSMSLYHQHPRENSGKLTLLKDRQVANLNLYQLATKKNLKNYISAQEVRYGGKDRNWLPPSYTIASNDSDRYLTQQSKQKAFADMIEALIGAFLVSTDYYTTIEFMAWLGLDTIPKEEEKLITTTPSVLYSDRFENNHEIEKEIQQYYLEREFADVEKRIEYKFRNKAYVIAAFTHPSYSNSNRLTQCYDR